MRSPRRLARHAVAAAALLGVVACDGPRPRGEANAAPSSEGAAAKPAALPRLVAHPRLLLTPEILRRVKKKAAAKDPDWENLRREADRFAKMSVARYDRNAAPNDAIAYTYQGAGWLDAITTLGLAYQTTGAKKYAAKAREILREINATAAAGNLEPIACDSGFPTRTAALAAALGFDWLYAELSPAERAATVATLNRWYDWYKKEALDRSGPAVSNYFGGHLLGFTAAGYATAGDNPRAGEIVAHVRRELDDVVGPAFASNGPFAGGFPVEGYVYGSNHFVRLLEVLAIVRSATGAEPPHAREYADRIARNLFHALRPNRWQVPDEATYPGDYTGILTLGLPVMLTELLAGTPTGAGVQYLLANVGTPPKGIAIDRPSVDFLLYWDAGRPAKDYAAAEPLVLHSPGDEHLFMRSAWSPAAIWASFSGGLAQFSGHHARTAGHIALARGGDYLLPFAGQWKGSTGITGHPQQFQNTSAYANTLFVDDGGTYLYNAERYLGGQGAWGKSRPFPFVQRADLTWAKLDATSIYDLPPGSQNEATRSVRRFVRNVAYLAPATFVVFDRVSMLKPEYKKEIRFQLAAAPTVTGNLATSVVGSSALHIRALLPRPASLQVAWNTVDGARLNPRLAVAAAAPGTDLDALTVLAATDRREPAPEATLISSDGGVMIGAQVGPVGGSGAPARGSVALFAAAPTGTVPPAAAVRYRAAGAPARHFLFDLEPRRTFHVRAEPVAGAPAGTLAVTVAPDGAGAAIASDDAGTLSFDVAGGQIRPVP